MSDVTDVGGAALASAPSDNHGVARPRGRPNEMEPALIDLARRRGTEGLTILEAANQIPHVLNGRRTTRALAGAAMRLVQKGILRREQEWFRPDGNPEGVGMRYRYWCAD